jgi:hypothetical protein
MAERAAIDSVLARVERSSAKASCPDVSHNNNR